MYLRLKMRAPAGSVVEIRARVDQMLAQLDDYNNGQQLYLGGYVKADINSRPSSHALEQDWYKADATVIAEAIKSANPLLFP